MKLAKSTSQAQSLPLDTSYIFPACKRRPSCAALVLFSVRLNLMSLSLALSLFRVTCLLTGGLIRQLRDRIPSSKIIYFSATPECIPQICPLPPFKSPSPASRQRFLSDFFTFFFLNNSLRWRHLSLVIHDWPVSCTLSCCLVISQANFSWLLQPTSTRCGSLRQLLHMLHSNKSSRCASPQILLLNTESRESWSLPHHMEK